MEGSHQGKGKVHRSRATSLASRRNERFQYGLTHAVMSHANSTLVVFRPRNKGRHCTMLNPRVFHDAVAWMPSQFTCWGYGWCTPLTEATVSCQRCTSLYHSPVQLASSIHTPRGGDIQMQTLNTICPLRNDSAASPPITGYQQHSQWGGPVRLGGIVASRAHATPRTEEKSLDHLEAAGAKEPKENFCSSIVT